MGNCLSAPQAKYAVSDAKQVSDQLKAGPVAQEKERQGPEESCKIDSKQIPDEMILNLLHPTDGPAKGLPYECHWLGPPRPPCEDGRVETINAVGKEFNSPEDPEITSILKLTASMFKAPVALVALFDDKRVFVSEQTGNVIPRGDFPWRWTLCAWSLAYNNAQILVIPDTLQDARFAENEKVTVFPKVRFYCGAPLVASNGHRLGTLCFADVAPRPEFDAASCYVMNNLSELVVRHLEKDLALKLKQRDNAVLQATYGQLQRALDCFNHCVVLLDVGVTGWQVLHVNAAWDKVTGLERNDAVGKTLSELFENQDGTMLPAQELLEPAAKCQDFQVTLARLAGECKEKGSGKKGFILTFRPASREGMDDSVVPIGIPTFLQHNKPDPQARRYYFMSVDASATRLNNLLAGRGSVASSWGTSSMASIEGLELGHLLGKGAFGSVYHGTWHGTTVAVKVVDQDLREVPGMDGTPLEALLGRELRHPYIVSTLHYAVRKVTQLTTTNATNLVSSALSSCDIKAPMDCKAKSLDLTSTLPQVQPAQMPDDSSGCNALSAACAIEASTAAACQPGDNAWPVIDVAAMIGSGSDWPQMHLPVAAGDKAAYSVPSNRSNVTCQTIIILEYCDKGCLQEAIDRGWLRTVRSCTGEPNVTAVVETCSEIARAMCYLHANNVMHGDLSSWNVMLCSSGVTSHVGNRHFVAKVADFGMARSLDIKSRIQTRTYGTLTHMPPETLTEGIISKQVDVYSFGVLMWQMWTGSRPWAGLTHSQIIMTVGNQKKRLVFPPSTLPAYQAIALACMDSDPSRRPSFDVICKMLEMDLTKVSEAAVADLSA